MHPLRALESGIISFIAVPSLRIKMLTLDILGPTRHLDGFKIATKTEDKMRIAMV